MDGGALLGSGTYGCVFDHPLRTISSEDGSCKDNISSKPVVAKITESEEAANEMDAAKIVSQIPNYAAYFSIPDVSTLGMPCAVNAQKEEPDIDKCPIIKKIPMSRMLHFTMPYAGRELHKHMSIHLKDTKIMPVEKTVRHLLEGGALLALYNYVHYDLHRGNILFDDETGTPRIIDFGFSFSANNITTDTLSTRWKRYSPDFLYEAPEVTIITGYRKGISLNTLINDVLTERSVFKTCQFILNMPIAFQSKSFREFWTNSKSIQQKDWLSFFKYYWTGFDAWSLGVVLLEMYIKFANTSAYTDLADWGQTESHMRKILRGLLKMNPAYRIDCVEALNMFYPESPILETEAATQWIKERKRIRAPFNQSS